MRLAEYNLQHLGRPNNLQPPKDNSAPSSDRHCRLQYRRCAHTALARLAPSRPVSMLDEWRGQYDVNAKCRQPNKAIAGHKLRGPPSSTPRRSHCTHGLKVASTSTSRTNALGPVTHPRQISSTLLSAVIVQHNAFTAALRSCHAHKVQGGTYPSAAFLQPLRRIHHSAVTAVPLIATPIRTQTSAKNGFYRSCSLCRPSKQLCCKQATKNASHTASQRHYPISLTADSRRLPSVALEPQQRTSWNKVRTPCGAYKLIPLQR